MKVQQLEISFPSRSWAGARGHRPPRSQRAQWWFQQMRRVVDQALDWSNLDPGSQRSGLELAMACTPATSAATLVGRGKSDGASSV